MQSIMERRHTESLDAKPKIRSDFILPLFTPQINIHMLNLAPDWSYYLEELYTLHK